MWRLICKCLISKLRYQTDLSVPGAKIISLVYNRTNHCFCILAVVIDSGSRYEVNFPSGISHFLEKLAFSVS